MESKVPFPMLFKEQMVATDLSVGVNDYDPREQVVPGFGAMGPSMTTCETATGGHGDTDTDTDSD